MPDGDSLRKVTSGQDFRIPADAYNAFVDAANDLRQRKAGSNSDREARPKAWGTTALVQNLTGGPLKRFDVVRLGPPIVTYAERQSTFLDTPNFEVLPVRDPLTSCDVLAVMLEPLAANKIGHATVWGLTPAVVTVGAGAESFRFAKGHEDAVALDATETGPVRIVWKEDGTGEKHALVILGPSNCPDEFDDHDSSDDSSEDGSSDDSSADDTTCEPIEILETEARFEGGRLCFYRRTVTLAIVAGCLHRDFAEWEFVGCACVCDESSSSDDSSESSSSDGIVVECLDLHEMPLSIPVRFVVNGEPPVYGTLDAVNPDDPNNTQWSLRDPVATPGVWASGIEEFLLSCVFVAGTPDHYEWQLTQFSWNPGPTGLNGTGTTISNSPVQIDGSLSGEWAPYDGSNLYSVDWSVIE